MRPQLDFYKTSYGDVIYDQPFDKSLLSRIESIQYNATLAKAGAIRDSSCLLKSFIRN